MRQGGQMGQHIFSRPGVADAAAAKHQAKQKEPTEFERQTLVGLYATNKFAEAEALAQMLMARFPKHSLAWKVLGAVLKQTGRLAESLAPMQKAVVLAPRDWQAHNNLGVTLKDLGKTDQAIAAYRRAIALNPDFPEAHANLGAALREQGLSAEALQCYQRKLALSPDDPDATFMVKLLSGEQVERPPAVHVKGVFDHYAPTFDAHLVDKLGYQVPRQLVDLIAASPCGQRHDLRVLDLGCGTGLVGAAIKPHAAELVGVDLSPKMLERAAQKNVYNRLVCADLVSMMQSEPDAHYDIILAADVFIYVGVLDDVVTQAQRLLKPGGMLCFSVESSSSPDAGYVLQQSGRYAHAQHYLDHLRQAHHFGPITYLPSTLRMDKLQPINGHLVAWQAQAAPR